jgi:tetratricopeptide (TPR) repeat protein
MTHRGLRALGCALALLVVLPTSLCSADRDDPTATKLAVQNALRRGREMMTAQQYEEAVVVLEAELEHANGSREYLAALRDAYRSYVQQLKLAKRDGDVDVYQRRLKILDPGCVLDPAVTASSAPKPAPINDAPKKSPEKPIVKDPSPPPGDAKKKEAQSFVAQAREAYDKRKFDEACKCFDQAQQLDPQALVGCQEQWAYSKLYRVVDQLQKGIDEPAQCTQLEKEVRLAMSLAPTQQLEDFGKKLLERIDDRRGKKGSGSGDVASRAQGSGDSNVTVQHRNDAVDGWQVAQTQNVRVYHHKQAEFAERAAKLAEKTRVDMQMKWIGKTESWSPPCEIYLHDSADSYSAITKVPRSLPGHSAIRLEKGKGVIERKVHLRCDDLNLLVGTLPHEVTHVVIAGQFGDSLPPRWADEGVAVLTEPRERIDLHLRNLPTHQAGHELFRIRDLMRADDYPDPQRMGAFYAQSVSLVDFLTRKKQPSVFMQFVRDGMSSGYDGALRKYYGYDSFEALESDWMAFAFNTGKTTVGK